MVTIAFDSAGVAIDDRAVLHPLDLSLTERRIAVIGLNGSGKSTFARLINGLAKPTSGHVRVDGLDTVADGRAVRRKVGFVFQAPENQIVFPIVEEDVAFGLRNRGRDRPSARAEARAMLEKLGIGTLAERSSHTLSGGERQLVALAGVLATAPDLIVFDEPTTQLDLSNRNRVAAAIDRLDAAAVVVTHDLDLIAGFERCLVLHGGRIHFDGPPAEGLAAYRAVAA